MNPYIPTNLQKKFASLPPVTQEEFNTIQKLCNKSIDFNRQLPKNGPNRLIYIARKTSELLSQFEATGGRSDAVIRSCFQHTLEGIVPQPITTDDWAKVAIDIHDTPDELFTS